MQGMATKPFNFRLPADLMERVDRERGDVPRTRFVVRALEAALETGGDPARSRGPLAESVAEPASPRTPSHAEASASKLLESTLPKPNGGPKKLTPDQRYGPRRPRPKGIA